MHTHTHTHTNSLSSFSLTHTHSHILSSQELGAIMCAVVVDGNKASNAFFKNKPSENVEVFQSFDLHNFHFFSGLILARYCLINYLILLRYSSIFFSVFSFAVLFCTNFYQCNLLLLFVSLPIISTCLHFSLLLISHPIPFNYLLPSLHLSSSIFLSILISSFSLF